MTGLADAWLSTRWLEPLTTARDARAAARKGRVIARKGWVRNLSVRPGLVTAEVQDDNGAAHSVKIRMAPLDGEVWSAVLDRLAKEAGYAAMLMAGRFGEDLVGVFEEAGVELFPFDLRDVHNFCSCRETRGPVCTHAAATHFALADAIAAAPFVLFEFRGRSKDEALEEVRSRRPTSLGAEPEDAGDEDLEPSTVVADGYLARGVVPHLAFRVDREELDADETLPVVRALGPGPGDVDPDLVAHVLAPLTVTGRRRVDRIGEQASGEDEMGTTPDPAGAQSLDDLLVAAARQHGALSSGFVAGALGVSPLEARRYLKWLVDEGRLARVGRARGTKYVPLDSPLLEQ